MVEMRPLGKSGLSTAPLVLGGNVFGWTADEAMSFRILDAFVDEGFNAIDTADVYSRFVPGNKGGESETIIGKWLKEGGKRGKVLIATKLGMDMGDGKQGLSRAYMMRAVEDSLKRLQTDVIDLYQSHRDDDKTPLEETLSAYADLIKQGKVRAIGASNYSAARLREALDISKRLGIPRYETVQPLYNLHDRTVYEGELAQLCEAEGIACIPFFALASGFLTGKYRSEADFGKSQRGAQMGRYLSPRGKGILAALDAAAEKTKANQAQVALAWLMAKQGVSPIASATNVDQLREICGAARVKLDGDTMRALDTASAA